MTAQDDGLFLLEALVEKITFLENCNVEKDAFKTHVTIQCPATPLLEICEGDVEECESHRPIVRLNSGKSCLFPLNEEQINEYMNNFAVQVIVTKAINGSFPRKVPVGSATIDMTKEFVQAKLNNLHPVNTSYQALKDSFDLYGPDGFPTGNIAIFLRISSFGNLIVTSFKGAVSPPKTKIDNSILVNRACVADNPYQQNRNAQICMPAQNDKMKKSDSKAAQEHTDSKATHELPCSEGGKEREKCPPAKDPYNSKPCEDSDDPCYCSGPRPHQKQTPVCRNADQYCLHTPKGRSKQFEEIGMNLGGNELKIKVPASASVIKKISQTHCTLQRPYTKGTDTSPCEAPCGRNQISLALPSEDSCCQGGAQLAGTQFTCTTEGCTQASKHGQQGARGDTKDVSLQNRDVFVLKVAKTAMQGDKKCKFEVELVTPKGPDKKRPIQKSNAKMQSDCDCECCIRRIKRIKKKCC